MGLLTPSEETCQTGHDNAVRRTYRSDQELAMRDALEGWCRSRWPDARLVHELVMGRGVVRADLAAVSPGHLAAFEIKSEYDDTSRLMHQVGMFRLAVPELWIVTAARHAEDAKALHYLLPSVGVLLVTGAGEGRGKIDRTAVVIEVIAEATPFAPLAKAMLSLLWVAELAAEATRSRLIQCAPSKPPTHSRLVEAVLKLTPGEQMEVVCRQLRGREMMWRADPPVREISA